MGSLTLLSEFASTPPLSKTATPLGLEVPALDLIKCNTASCNHQSEILLVQSLLVFMRDTSKEFQQAPLKSDPKQLWVSIHHMFTGAVMAL